MSTLKSSSTDLTLNADGVGNDIIFQSNAGEVGKLTAEGVLTATSFVGSAATLTGLAGEVTGTAGANTIAANVVDEANLKVSNSPTNGYVLTAQSGASGGLTWAADSTTDSTKLPLAGGTMTGHILHGDNIHAKFGVGNDLDIYHNGSHSYIKDTGTGNLVLTASASVKIDANNGDNMAEFTEDGAVSLFHNNVKKFETTANGVTVTGTAIATTDTDATNTGSVTLDFATNQNFVLTLTGNVTLANPSTEQVGQSGFIAFIQDSTGSRTVALGTDYETPAAAGLTLTSTASATDLVPYLVVASNRILLGAPQLAFA